MAKRRTPETTHSKLQALDQARTRWWRRLKRAVNALDEIDQRRRRLLKSRTLDQLDPPVPEFNDPLPVQAVTEVTELTKAGGFGIPLDDDLDVRTRPWAHARIAHLAQDLPEAAREAAIDAGLIKDEKAAAALKAERAETKRRKAAGQAAKRKAKLAGDLRKMPLQGKAALDAIRKAE